MKAMSLHYMKESGKLSLSEDYYDTTFSIAVARDKRGEY
jgi:hypothetical protein